YLLEVGHISASATTTRRFATSHSAGRAVPGASGLREIRQFPCRGTRDVFTDEFHDEFRESWITIRCGGTREPHSVFPSAFSSLVVEIPDDLKMIGHESDGTHHDVGDAVRVQRVDVVDNVRFQPGHLARSGTRLPDDIVITQPGTFRDEPRGLEHLPRVALTTRAGRPGRMVGDGRNGVG